MIEDEPDSGMASPAADARDWLEEVIDQQAERAFLDAFPRRTDILPHDRIILGEFVFVLRSCTGARTLVVPSMASAMRPPTPSPSRPW